MFLMFLCGTTAQNCVVVEAGCCMCRAGTVMAAGGDCEQPRCVACDLYTYMDKHNRLTTCMRQPYCDPTKNFIHQNSSSSLTYAFFYMDGRHSIRTVEDRSKRELYSTDPRFETPLCSKLHHFVTYCMPCWSSTGGTAVVCQRGVRPKFANGQPQWSDTYDPKYSLYSPTKRLRCVCKPGFHCSSDECMTCIEGEEYTVALGIISAYVVLVLLLICGLSFRYHSVLRVVCVRAGNECRVGLSAVNDCITGLVRQLNKRPATQIAIVLTVSHADNVISDTPNREEPMTDCDQVRTIGERKIAGVRVTIIFYAVTTGTLLATLIVGTLYATDRLLTTYCDSAISVYTFPLGYTVTSKGVQNLEALALSGFLNRCRKQNEFVVPANIRFHKAIRCLRGSREYKRASGDATQIKQSHGSKDSVSGHAGVSVSMLGVTASAEVTFSRTDAVERSMERTVSSSNRLSVSSSSYQCRVGSATFSSYEPTTALRMSVKELNLDPDGYIDDFLDTWGYGFVSSVEVGGYYSSFEVFSTCNKDAEDSLNDAAERCREKGAKVEVSGLGVGASAGGSTSRCNTEGLSEYQKKALSSISRQSQYVQIGGDDLGGESEWESTLKMNPYPLRVRITPIFHINGMSQTAVELLKRKLQNVKLYPDEFLAEQVPDIMPRRC